MTLITWFSPPVPAPAPPRTRRIRSDAWTAEQLDYVKARYPHDTITEVAAHIGRSYNSVKTMAQKVLRLRKTAEFIEAVKGRRLAAGRHTMFQQGALPHNTKSADGVITIRHQKSKKMPPYKYIRLGIGKWKELHRHLWEQANGPIPKDHVCVFKNGDSLDCRLDNLELITLVENRIRNSASTLLGDRFVANNIAWRDPELRDHLVEHHPELIDLKRKQILLNRAIREQRNANQD